ncbi:MAG: hypothetical protein E6I52_26895 [Chloroflexi bacterium]|nr:MAG: hypothetical protein E6I52_26895 [Chloroflexota bacterium]
MAGGALLILFYAVLIVRQAIDWQAGPTLGTPIHLPLMRIISAALVLLIVGLLGVLTARTDSLGWMPLVGGLVTLGGFGLWAYAAAENFLPIAEPWWLHPLLFPALVAVGSLVFGLGALRSRALPQGAAALVAFFGVLGMTLLANVEIGNQSSSPGYAVVRVAGFIAILLYGGGWVWLGYRFWRPSTVG